MPEHWLGPAELIAGVPARRVRPDREQGWRETVAAWRALPPHPSVLQLEDGAWIRYAQLKPAVEDSPGRLVTWMLTLCEVFQLVASVAGTARLARPVAAMDRGHGLRVGFLPASCVDADDVGLDVPLAGDQFASVIAAVVVRQQWAIAAIPTLYRLVVQARDSKRKRRPDLASFAAKIEAVGLHARPRSELEHAAWARYHLGRGWEALGDAESADRAYREALMYDVDFRIARSACQALRRAAVSGEAGVTRRVETPLWFDSPSTAGWQPVPIALAATWVEEETRLLSLEVAGDFETARMRYHAAAGKWPEARLGLARSHLAMGAFADAAWQAARAPQRFDGLVVEAVAHARRGEHDKALWCADQLLELADDDADAHYLRGKALFALGRLVDARDAFERAFALRPMLVEAMHLRREVDRAMAAVRRGAGASGSIPRAAGPLADVMSMIASGWHDAALDALADKPEPEAQRLRAHCLAFLGRHADALAIYAALTDHASRVGAAHALLALDRATDALAAFDAALAARPSDLDALDGRARALDQLGRAADAERTHQRAAALALGRGERRAKARS